MKARHIAVILSTIAFSAQAAQAQSAMEISWLPVASAKLLPIKDTNVKAGGRVSLSERWERDGSHSMNLNASVGVSVPEKFVGFHNYDAASDKCHSDSE